MNHWGRVTSRRFMRFLLAGAANTSVNFLVLNLAVYAFHQPKILASVIATSSAILCSFVLNRGFVFLDHAHPGKQLLRFMLVSVLGVLVVQTSVYTLALVALAGVPALSDGWQINLSNLIASAAVTFWNYNGYRLFVFTSQGHKADVSPIEDDLSEAA